MKKLPVFELILSENTDESTGVSIISFVEKPAIEETFVFFSKEEPQSLKFAIQEDRHIVTGPVLIPGMKILRNIPEPREVFFTKDMIERVVKKFFKTDRVKNVNAEHSSLLLNGIYPFESFISDSTRGINAPTQFSSLPDGTWFLSYSIEDPAIWEQVKNGTFNGYSIEGLFREVEVKMSQVIADTEDYADWVELINALN